MSAQAGPSSSLPVPPPSHNYDPSIASDTTSDWRTYTTDSRSATPSSASSRLPLPEVQTYPQPLPLRQRVPSNPPPPIPTAPPPLTMPPQGANPSDNANPSTPVLTSAPTSATPLTPAVPVDPLPDSLLCRSTFTALEHSAGTLKRLAKPVLASTATVMALLEQLETAEDELLSHLGELGRWLEGGYGVSGHVWDSDGGIRKVAKQKRAREREELEAMVGHSLEAVRGEIKRQGLAGGAAAGKFEGVSKQYYSQTASYLQGGATSETSDKAHAARAAQFDLARYNYHSTLLYAVPPSSLGCLDLLVGLYSWAGAHISDAPVRNSDATAPRNDGDEFPRPRKSATAPSPDTPTQKGRQLAASEIPVRLLLRDDERAQSSVNALSRTLALSLAHIAQVRGDLLQGWADRDALTTQLEDRANQLGALSPETALPQTIPAPEAPQDMGIRFDKPKKKIGGKIRGLFSSSPSTVAASSLAQRAPPVSSSMLAPPPQGKHSRRSMEMPRRGMSTPSAASSSQEAGQKRRSMQLTRERSPFMTSDKESSSSTKPRAEALAETTAKLNGANVGAVGGLDGTGDEDEQRELVGRKKEGVLWGTGTWEVLDKNGGKGKWERFYVVLAHSNLYEYRDHPGKPDTAAAVIDLKFASVREGRGTDRRFAFEIVTASHGRRLYQAMSEAEMKTWIYAIMNAIESCINGTSTVRSSDRKMMAEDMAAEEKRKGEQSDPRRMSMPMTKHKAAGTGNRSSLPSTHGAHDGAKNKRRTSLKSRFKQGSGGISDKVAQAVSSKRDSMDLDRAAFMKTDRASKGPLPTPKQSWQSKTDGDIEKRVYEMAGLSLDPQSAKSTSSQPVQSPKATAATAVPPTPPVTAVAQPPPPLKLDMATLKRIAGTGANQYCADCGRLNRNRRWATLSLREVPMVMFLCIRCVGIHRGLGTHVSKPRSVDLDNWSPEAVLLAHQWGNERGNGMWERLKPQDTVPNEEDMAEYINAKYVEGRWLSDSDRAMVGLAARRPARGGGGGEHSSVGRAL